MENLEQRMPIMKGRFDELFGSTDGEGASSGDIRVFRSPGRVNLIGEHTDYNGGLVLPAAIDYCTLAFIRARTDDLVRLESLDVQPGAQVKLSELIPVKGRWVNYPLGVVTQLQKLGKSLRGFEMLIASNVPSGAGLSSSASVELATAVAANTVFNLGLSMMDLVKLSQRAENEFVGVMCGIMDQFAVGMGRADAAIAIDCKSMEHKYVSAKLEGYTLMVINTNKRRGLADSKYNERRAQCEAGLEALRTRLPEKDCLGAISTGEYEVNKGLIKDDTVKKRVEHVIYENERVRACMSALQAGDSAGVAGALTGSHESLRDLYEVTGHELDALYSLGMASPGALAVRMTGAGFGGCAMAYVKTEEVKAFMDELAEGYTMEVGYEPTFYEVNLADGASEVEPL